MVGTLALIAVLAAAAGETPASAAPAATAAAGASTAPTQGATLREIGHVRAITTFCAAFERHFNGAARPILASDTQASYIGFTLGNIEPHFHARGGELLLYDDRVNMMHYVGNVQKLVPQAQREIDALRTSAPLANDPATAAQTLELARHLQKALDKQRQIAIDSLSVVQALNDVTLGTNDNTAHATAVYDERRVALIDPLEHLAAIRDASGPRAPTTLQAQPPGAYDPYTASTPANWRDVRSYLHWQDQLDRIGDAEAVAARDAEAVAGRCR